MATTEKQCRCGAVQQVAELELVRRYRCAACGQEDAVLERVPLSTPSGEGELPGREGPGRETVQLPRGASPAEPDTPTAPILAPESAVLAPDSAIDWLRAAAAAPPARTREVEAAQAHSRGSDQPLLPAGTVLGSYEVVASLGQGGMGVVYKARDVSLDRFVALKVLNPDLCRNQQFLERFDREAKAVARLSHPHITTIYHYSKGDRFFAMEFVDGENLADRLKREGPFPIPLVLDVARQTALGLKAAASSKIIHRDIKPSNLLLTREGMLKITDFGLAKAKAAMGHTLDLTSTGVVMGTPLFMSPEQARGGAVDHRSDVYSLGATLFFLVYGCPPFEADSPIAIILKHINDVVRFPEREDVPESLRGLLRRMLAKDVSRRPPDYDALLADLERVARGEALEEDARRVIVLNARRGTAKRSLFSTGKLSVAKTNLKLGRRDKATSLLQEAVQDSDPGLRCEAALLLLDLYESERDEPGVRRMAEVLLESAREPALTAFAAWKLAELDERQAAGQLRHALERYERVLRDPPEDLPRALIEQQIRRVKDLLAAAEREGGTTAIHLGNSG